MEQPFSVRVAAAGWRRDVDSWIGEQLADRGVEVTGPTVQPRIRPWSTQLTAPTDVGTVWFKASCAALAFEPVLQSELSRLVPGAVDEPLAVDADRGWLLTRDRRTTLGDSHEPTVDDWREVLGQAGRVQQAVASHGERLLATGMPDCAPSTVVDRFDRIVATFRRLPEEHPSHIDPDLAMQLLDGRPAIVDAVAVLEKSALPTSWQHGDLHPRNVFATDDGLRLFDLGDSQWAHVTELLSVPYGCVTTGGVLPWLAVLESWCEVWGLTTRDVVDVCAAAALTQPVNRVLLWWGCLAEATAAEWSTWGYEPLQHLRRVLEP